MGSPSNALTEIALALAMGFFAIMIVAIVSLGAGPGSGNGRPEPAEGRPQVARVVKAKPGDPSAERQRAPGDTRFVIYHAGRFLDREMNPVDPDGITAGEAGRVVLALPPDLPMQEVLAARRKITGVDPVVAALTEDWMAALRRKQP